MPTQSDAAAKQSPYGEDFERKHPLGFSKSLNPIRTDLRVALNNLPEDGFVFDRASIERIADALGGWDRLREVIYGSRD